MTITLSAEWFAAIRERAEQNASLCLHEHTLHREHSEVRFTCDRPGEAETIGTLTLLEARGDIEEQVRHFLDRVVGDHDRKAAANAVLALLAALVPS